MSDDSVGEVQRWTAKRRAALVASILRGETSAPERSNQRWAMDLTHIPVGYEGWAHLAAVIDCHDRTILGHECSLRGRATEAEKALEDVCLLRFGTLCCIPRGLGPDGPCPNVSVPPSGHAIISSAKDSHGFGGKAHAIV